MSEDPRDDLAADTRLELVYIYEDVGGVLRAWIEDVCTRDVSCGCDGAFNQACAESAFAKSMGWHDWTYDEESVAGMVRGCRVQWSPDDDAGLVVSDAVDDEARYVLVTGRAPFFMVHGWITAGEAKQRGRKIGDG